MLTILCPTVSAQSFSGKEDFLRHMGNSPMFAAHTFKGTVFFTVEDIRPHGVTNIGIRFKDTCPIRMATWAMLHPCIA